MSGEPKFCKDCKHYVPVPSLGQYQIWSIQNAWNRPAVATPDWYKDWCTHPSKQSLVTGCASEDPKMMRAHSCGPDGRLWEEKQPEQPLPELPSLREQLEAAYNQEPSKPARRWWEFCKRWE